MCEVSDRWVSFQQYLKLSNQSQNVAFFVGLVVEIFLQIVSPPPHLKVELLI